MARDLEKLKEKRRRYRLKYRDKIAQRLRDFRANNPGIQTEYNKRREPRKTIARILVHEALRKGRLVRPDKCTQCMKTGIVEAHHTDYDKPLDIVWLCKDCHLRV